MFAEAGLAIDEYPGRAISYEALEDWAGLGLGGAILDESKVRTRDPLPVVMLPNGPALLTYDAMWPTDLLASHVRGFARKLPSLARSLFPLHAGHLGTPDRRSRDSGRCHAADDSLHPAPGPWILPDDRGNHRRPQPGGL